MALKAHLRNIWTNAQGWVIVTGFSLLMIKECITVSIHLSQFNYFLGILSGSLFVSMGSYILWLLHKCLSKWQKTLLLFLTGGAIILLLGDAGSANAQFLQNAEDFFVAGADTFGLGDPIKLLVQLIFWIIRGAFVIGVAIALLPAIQAAREGDEWRSLAKTPMLVTGIFLAGATSVDILVGGAGTP